MFTGFITACGHILAIENTPGGKRFHIACPYSDLAQGESIAVDGICLTVASFSTHQFTCDLSSETLSLTRAAYLKPNDVVNLERSLCLGDRLNGHFVTGHVDQIAKVAAKIQQGDYIAYRFTGVKDEAKAYLVKKGSVTINGVSLTINEVYENGFEVMLVPETLNKTNLSSLTVGDWVNIEYDCLAKLIVNVYIQRATHENKDF